VSSGATGVSFGVPGENYVAIFATARAQRKSREIGLLLHVSVGNFGRTGATGATIGGAMIGIPINIGDGVMTILIAVMAGGTGDGRVFVS
jgi:hypothetical protein